MKPICFLLLLSAALAGCVQTDMVEKIDTSGFEAKLVVHAFITPNKPIYVAVQLTTNVTQTEADNIWGYLTEATNLAKNARVALTDIETTQSVVLKELPDGSYYVSEKDFVLNPGKRYNLSVQYKNLSVKSTCKIPPKVAQIDSFYNTLPIKEKEDTPYNKSTGKRYEVFISGKDVSDEKEYYSYLANFHGIYTNSTTKQEYAWMGFTKKANGRIIFSTRAGLSDQTIEEIIYYRFLTVYPYLTDYMENQQLLVRSNEDLQRSPFRAFKGVLLAKTNIEGGFGIFAGYLPSNEIVITVKQ